MTQGDLALATGVSYQQIHKYEHGTNRISAGRLGLIADVLHMSVQSFYDGFANSYSNGMVPVETDNRMCMELARSFRQIGNPRHQEALHLLVRILAS